MTLLLRCMRSMAIVALAIYSGSLHAGVSAARQFLIRVQLNESELTAQAARLRDKQAYDQIEAAIAAQLARSADSLFVHLGVGKVCSSDSTSLAVVSTALRQAIEPLGESQQALQVIADLRGDFILLIAQHILSQRSVTDAYKATLAQRLHDVALQDPAALKEIALTLLPRERQEMLMKNMGGLIKARTAVIAEGVMPANIGVSAVPVVTPLVAPLVAPHSGRAVEGDGAIALSSLPKDDLFSVAFARSQGQAIELQFVEVRHTK